MPLMFGYLGLFTSALFLPGLLWALISGRLTRHLTSTIVGWLVCVSLPLCSDP
eukprot:COSAG06_NODE_55734_length_288_cov_0.814815_1_plen_52_part_10